MWGRRGRFVLSRRLLEEKDLEILRLRSLLAEEAEKAERAETAKVVRLCGIGLPLRFLPFEPIFQVFTRRRMLAGESAPCALYTVIFVVAELEAHVMDVSGRLEGEFYPAYLTTLAGRRWFLTHGIQLAMLKCIKSPEYQGILGHALGRAVDFGMHEGLEMPGWHVVLDCFILDGPLADLPEAAHLQPYLEQLSIPIHHSDDKVIVRETSLSFALLNVHSRTEGAKKHAAALRQLMMKIVSKPCLLRLGG
ncbi:hypothetical protein Tco_0823509 [Tanacetum coccineum]|uniref:Uncharacterized protein n=1 Tax=Tanacetum coccineum TaxID=301880 RepID=A0ABQ5AI80_9ASTR